MVANPAGKRCSGSAAGARVPAPGPSPRWPCHRSSSCSASSLACSGSFSFLPGSALALCRGAGGAPAAWGLFLFQSIPHTHPLAGSLPPPRRCRYPSRRYRGRRCRSPGQVRMLPRSPPLPRPVCVAPCERMSPPLPRVPRWGHTPHSGCCVCEACCVCAAWALPLAGCRGSRACPRCLPR